MRGIERHCVHFSARSLEPKQAHILRHFDAHRRYASANKCRRLKHYYFCHFAKLSYELFRTGGILLSRHGSRRRCECHLTCQTHLYPMCNRSQPVTLPRCCLRGPGKMSCRVYIFIYRFYIEEIFIYRHKQAKVPVPPRQYKFRHFKASRLLIILLEAQYIFHAQSTKSIIVPHRPLKCDAQSYPPMVIYEKKRQRKAPVHYY